MNYNNILKWIFEEKKPENVQKIDELLNKYKGVEKELLSSVYEKYELSSEEIEKIENGINPFAKQKEFQTENNVENTLIQTAQKEQKPFPVKIVLGVLCIIALIVVLVVLIPRNNNSTADSNGEEKEDHIQETDINKNEGDGSSEMDEDFDYLSYIEFPLEPEKITASSFIKSSQGLTYVPENIADGDMQTWWSPKQSSSKEWIKVHFDKVYNIIGISIHAGSHYKDFKNYGDLYYLNSRITKMKLEFSDGSSLIAVLEDVDELQSLNINSVKSSFIKITPLEWKKGNKWDDICISELQIHASTE
jgi:hypothetical protein